MEANDLRVGNLILDHEADPTVKIHWEVEEVLKDGVRFRDGSCWTAYEAVEPIPLTEEWLVKFGFDEITNVDNCDFKEYRMFNKHSFAIQFPCGNEAHCYAGNYPIAIKHVHQLQNLYHALTGEELTIKTT